MFNREPFTGIDRIFPVGVALLLLVTALPVAAEMPPIDWSGSIGYTYRSLSTPNEDTTSNQFLGTLNAATYFWRPWFAQVNGHATMTLDNTESGSSNSTDSNIVTGELNLSVLPQSATPFTLDYRRSDSRVDTTTTSSTNNNNLITIGQDFTTERLGLTQSYITSGGDRYRAKYDYNQWDSSTSGTIEDKQVGLEMDLRKATQRLIAEGTVHTTDRLQTDETRDNLLLELDHFYYPKKSLRIDTLANVVQTEDTFEVVSTTGTRETDQTQLSSFVFWRPQDRPLTVSGGVRFFDLSSTGSTSQTADITNMSATAGALYQMTKALRFDARLDYAVLDNSVLATTATTPSSSSSTITNARAGALYRSDVHDIFGGVNYQWFANGFFLTQKAEVENTTTFGGTLSHDFQRYWLYSKYSTFRGTFSQSLSPTVQSGDTTDSNYTRLDNSLSGAWDHVRWGGTSMTQLILQDSRDFGDLEDNQQLITLQFNRSQPLSRMMTLSGNLTYQSVDQDFGSLGQSSSDTLTYQLTFQHSRLAGVPRLRYLSDLSHSEASKDTGYDRFEWENRLDYNIGLVDARLSWRMFDQGGDKTDLIYFQVTRNF
jgi:hypothetical protein